MKTLIPILIAGSLVIGCSNDDSMNGPADQTNSAGVEDLDTDFEARALIGMEMKIFTGVAGSYWALHKRFPGPTLQDAVQELNAQPAASEYVRGFDSVVANRDPWGQEFVFVVDKDGQRLRIQSRGPDGKLGSDDDVTVIHDMSEYQSGK